MDKKTRQKVLDKYAGKCAYCGCDLTLATMQVDHIDAKYRGGKDDISNYNPACRQCNFYKSTFDIETFRTQMKSLHDRLNKQFIYRLAVKYGIITENNFEKFYFERIKNGK